MALDAKRMARRLHDTTASRRLIPVAVDLQVARLRADRAWQVPQRNESAQRQMRYLVGQSSRAAEVEELAHRFLYETYKRDELRWRPWLITHQPVEGMQRLHTAASSGHGVLVSFMHHGQYDGMFASINGLSLGLQTAGNANLLAGEHYGYRKRHTGNVRLGSTLFNVTAGFNAMREMLTSGGFLALASDVASTGSLTVDLLGRRVRAATGAARLSHDAGALVVVVTAHKEGTLQRLHVQEPFGARDFATFEGVQEEIFLRHSPALLAWPEGVEQPLLRGAPSPEDAAEFALGDAERQALWV